MSTFVSHHQSCIYPYAGEDKLVLLWNIQDHISTLGEASSTKYPTALFDNSRGMDSPTVEPQGFYKGHTDTVEDVQFRPSR